MCFYFTSLQYMHHNLIVMKCLILNNRRNQSVVDIFLEVQDFLLPIVILLYHDFEGANHTTVFHEVVSLVPDEIYLRL